MASACQMTKKIPYLAKLVPPPFASLILQAGAEGAAGLPLY